MTTFKRKLWVAGVVIAGAIGYLAFAGVKQGWVYYVSVDQYAQDQSQQKHRVRLMGTVADEGLVIAPARMKADFNIAGVTQRVPVTYNGAIPDLFKPGAEVVVEGKLNSAGRFQADILLTKCASKYDSKHQTTPKPDAAKLNTGVAMNPLKQEARP